MIGKLNSKRSGPGLGQEFKIAVSGKLSDAEGFVPRVLNRAEAGGQIFPDP
jgi:hypothetical protein